jgi:cysteine-rich repeat protein
VLVEPRRPVARLTRAFVLAVALGGGIARAHCDVAQLCAVTADPCEVRGTHELDDGCELDFDGRAVVVIGTVTTVAPGGDFTLRTGALTLDGGVLRARGAPESTGRITVLASGPFVMDPSSPLVDANGADGGGTIRVTAPAIELRPGSTVTADGTAGDASGGTVVLTSTGPDPVVIDGSVTARGQGGGDSSGGYVAIEGASLVVHATVHTGGSGSDGGPIDLVARTGDVTIADDALVVARAGTSDESGGMGGSIEVDAAGSIVVAGSVVSEGPGPDGSGGELNLSALDSVRIDHVVSVTGNGTESDGGDVVIEAGSTVTINAHLDAAAGGSQASGGSIDVETNGGVTIPAGVSLKVGGGSGGGSVRVVGHATVTLAGTVDATAGTGGAGGDVTIEGCAVGIDGTIDTEPAGALSAGTIAVVAAALTVGPDGRLLADPPLDLPSTFLSTNAFTLRAGAPVVSPGALIRPPYETHLDPLLTICCGNGVLDAGETCDDSNRLRCDGCDPACAPEPPCPDDGNPCTTDCEQENGCAYRPETGAPCPADADACTADVCFFGTCVHPTLQCDDGVPCTLDACVPATGCVVTPDHAACDDGNHCTADTCSGTEGCTHADRPDQTPCDDQDLCTTEDACLSGECVPTGIPLECEDGDPCTIGECLPFAGCVQREDPVACGCVTPTGPSPAGTPCVDGNPCTSPDSCDGAGQCAGGPVCDDGDPCTTDVCFLACLHLDDGCPPSCAGQPDGVPCSDGAVCTVGACQGGACVGVPRACGDTEACDGIDFCHEYLGCRESFPPDDDPRCFTTPLDAFTCYKARTASGTTAFTAVEGLGVAASFDAFPADVRRPSGLCLPTSYDGADPLAQFHDDHLAGYKARAAGGTPRFARLRGVVVENHLGTLTIDAVARDRLFVPAAMSLGPSPADPVPPNPDAFYCYKAVVGSGTPRFTTITDVPVLDRFGVVRVDVVKPTRFCAPVDLAGEDPAVPTHGTYLMCYKTRPTASHSFLPRVVGVNDRFPAQTLYLTKREEVCLPSLRTGP